MKGSRTTPHTHANEAAADALKYAYFDRGIVTSSPKQKGDGAHHVTVQETRAPNDEPLPVQPTVHGDYYLPPENTPVRIAYNERGDPLVVGAAVPQVDSPEIWPGERIVSHPYSSTHVRFVRDGSLRIADKETPSMGFQFRPNNGTFKISDGSGYGIKSDGSGNLTIHAKSLDVTDQSTISWDSVSNF